MRSCIVFLPVLVVVRTMDLAYTKISFTTSRKPCLNDCKNKKCFTDYSLTEEACTPGNEIAPVYQTSRTQYKHNCLSRCGKYGYSYEWCFVSNKNDDWDYCSSETRTTWKKGQNTIHYGPCSDECKIDDYYKIHMCSNYHGSRNKCDPRAYSYIQARTTYGEKCVSKCDNNDGYNNYWCYDKNQNKEKCAPPAKPPALSEFVNIPVPRRIDCINTSKRTKRCNGIGEYRSNISASAQKLQEQDYFQTVSLNEYRNPVYQYTVQAPQNDEEPWLPLVLRANITSDTVRCGDITEAKYTTGLLIGHLIGGVKKPYNMVPLSATAEEKLRKYENDIYQWISKEGSVKVTIVIMYKDTLNPFALGINYSFVKEGKVFKEVMDEMVYNNLTANTKTSGVGRTQVLASTTVKPLDFEDVVGLVN